MANNQYQDSFPRGALVGAAVLVAATVAVVMALRLAHVAPMARVQSPQSPHTVVATRDLKFFDAANGDVLVYATSDDGSREHRIAVLEPGTNGFLRAVMRGLVQARKIKGAGPRVPFQLAERADGRLVLSDPVTGRHIYLRAFGPTNAQAFARLLPPAARRHRQRLAEADHD